MRTCGISTLNRGISTRDRSAATASGRCSSARLVYCATVLLTRVLVFAYDWPSARFMAQASGRWRVDGIIDDHSYLAHRSRRQHPGHCQRVSYRPYDWGHGGINSFSKKKPPFDHGMLSATEPAVVFANPVTRELSDMPDSRYR